MDNGLGLPNDGTVWIGLRHVWGGLEPFGLRAPDRRHHVYCLGKTGSGKTTLLRNLILQDLQAGRGVGVKPHWFLLSQTTGQEYVPQELPEWSESRSLRALAIERVAFNYLDGNAQGYARDRQIAISPIAFAPHRTLFHELAHVVLGHTAQGEELSDGEEISVNLRETEAECVALICCESLRLSGAEFCRGYIQHWLQGEAIPERAAQRIFKAADQILRSGRAGGTRDSTGS